MLKLRLQGRRCLLFSALKACAAKSRRRCDYHARGCQLFKTNEHHLACGFRTVYCPDITCQKEVQLNLVSCFFFTVFTLFRCTLNRPFKFFFAVFQECATLFLFPVSADLRALQGRASGGDGEAWQHHHDVQTLRS